MKHLYTLAAWLMVGSLSAQIDHWETLVFADDDWHYRVPSQAPSMDWYQPNFDASAWEIGPGGFGYGDDDDRTILAPTLSCFFRRTFQVTDKTAIQQLYLQFDYDDGILVYLNGHPITRRNLAGSGPVSFDTKASAEREATLYTGGETDQEFLAGARLQALLRNGENVLAVQVHNTRADDDDLTARVWLHAGINNSEYLYRETPELFRTPLLSSSNLPLVVIETTGEIVDEPKIGGTMHIIHHPEGTRNYLGETGDEYAGHIGIEIRGQTSAALFPKKSYGLETRDAAGENNNVSLFGMPAENDWVLHGPYSDKTLMRNVLTYELGRRTGRWAPRTQFCEVVINGDYRGVYVFTEKIKRDEGRLDLSKLKEDDNSGDEITGGYLFKIDKFDEAEEPAAWTSPYLPDDNRRRKTSYLLEYPKPEDVTPEQLEYIEDYVTGFEDAIYGSDPLHPEHGYRAYLDVPSFVDYMLTTELCKNVDGYRISTYLHKKKDSKGGKLHAGPIWDYNLALGNVDYCAGNATAGWALDFTEVCPDDLWLPPDFWSQLVKIDTTFANAMHCRWRELRGGAWSTEALMDFIDQQVGLLAEAQIRNLKRWPEMRYHIWPNAFVGDSYTAEIDYLKNWTRQRMEFMDELMFGTCGGSPPGGSFLLANAYPNPARERITFDLFGIGQQLWIYNGTGYLVYQQVVTESEVTVDIGDLPVGMYYYTVGNADNLSMQGKFVVH